MHLQTHPTTVKLVGTTHSGGMCLYVAELPEVEVGEGLEVAQAGGQGTHPIVVKAQRLQGDELT